MHRNKLFVPPPRLERVDRPRLLHTLQTGLNKALILVSAPAGYGKTTLVSTWLQDAGAPFAWISLDEGDDDPVCFLQCLIAALQAFLPSDRFNLIDLLQQTHPEGFTPVLNILIDEIAGVANPFVLVLDDFHTLRSMPVLGIVAYLLERMPAQMHLALISRTDPPLPLARLRSRDQLVEIRAEHLSFTVEECTDFLERVMGLPLSAADIAALEARTEGWIAGLQLAAIAVQGRADLHASVSAFTGSHYYIIDYLTEEALNRQPEPVRAFLLQTSILSSMCAALCEALIAPPAAEPSLGQSTLEMLERLNLFVIPLDEKHCWFRYHHLFAEVLQLHLERKNPRLVPELHRRASVWYAENDNFPDAIRHALKAGDPARAADLIEQNGCSLIMSGESYTLLKWVEAVDALTRTRPWLTVLKAWALAVTEGDSQPVETTLQSAEALITTTELTNEVRIVRGSIATIRAYRANLQAEPQHAEAFARQALEYLPDSDAFSCSLRSIATSIYGDSSWMNGSLESARQAYREAVRIGQASGNLYTTLIAQTDLAQVLTAQGQLHSAAGICAEILQSAVRDNGQLLPLADRALLGSAGIAYEWNDLIAAGEHIRRAIPLYRQWGSPGLFAEAFLLEARLERAQGGLEAARAALLSAEPPARDPHLSTKQSRRLQLALAQEWLAQGDVSYAAQLLQTVDPDADSDGSRPIQALDGPGELLRLRLMLALGEYAPAQMLAGRLLHQAEVEGRLGTTIEVLILQALACQALKDASQALEILDRALGLARAEGFARLFLDEGPPLAKLVFQANLHGRHRQYAAGLLPAFGLDRTESPRPIQDLIEPLTEREIEVLQLIETGRGNQDIAARLVISIPTVKRHISNIYAKLGAKNRTQAVSIGRELHLIQ